MQQAPHQSCLCRERNCRILCLNRMGRGLSRGRSAAPNNSLSARVEVKWALATAVVELRDTAGAIVTGTYFQTTLSASLGDRPEVSGMSVQVTWSHLCVSLLTSRVPEKQPSLCCSGFWPGGAIHILTLLFAVHSSVSGQSDSPVTVKASHGIWKGLGSSSGLLSCPPCSSSSSALCNS